MSQIWLYIVTDHPAKALMRALLCSEADRPDWCAVVTDPELIDQLPDGIRAIGLWFRGRGQTAAERAWRDRRCFGGIHGLSDADMARIEGWIEKRNAEEMRLALGDLPVRADIGHAPGVAAPKSASVLSRVPEDFRAMAFSQRWT